MLQQLTEQLIEECAACLARFWQMREEDREPDFFQEVKPHADYWHQHVLQWQQQADVFIQRCRPKYMHTMQVHNAQEAFTQFVVQSFYKGTSKKRFEQSILSTKYTLETFLKALKEAQYAE